MKKRSFLDTVLFFINSLLAIMLLFSYLLPFVSPNTVPLFAVLSLSVPVLFLLNILFAIYWIVRLKKQLILSTSIVILGFGYMSSIYKFSEKKVLLNDDVKVMSYNVRMFNIYGWKKDDSISQKISHFINEQNPDILTIQEFYDADNLEISYPHKYVKAKSKINKFGLAIYSKFPIVNSGSLDFKNTSNNIIFTDIVKGQDTIRVYNVHLESLGIKPDEENFGQKSSEKLIGRIKTAFKKQAIQTEQFLNHQKKWKGKVLVCGDFNNTAFSWVYRQFVKNKKDAFRVAGKGLGKTFDYSYPLRIDFILADTNFDINYFTTFNVKYSDHFPILARINFKK